jgi:hypothetical protein
MPEENKVPYLLTSDLKKKVQAQLTLDIQDDFYEVAKNSKDRFTYALKD